MTVVSDTLQQFSLSKTEISLYLNLLEAGPAGSLELAKRLELHRPRLAQLLKVLQEKGFVVSVETGKRIKFKAASPHVLVEKAKQLLTDTKHVLPELIMREQVRHKTDDIRVLHGEEGLALCFLDLVVSLGKGDVFYQINSSKDQPFVDSLVPESYRPLRDAKELERRTITTRYVGSFKKPRLERSIRYIEHTDEVFEHNVIQFIYGTKISLLDFNSLTGTIIDNKAIADFQRSIFLTLYKRLPQ